MQLRRTAASGRDGRPRISRRRRWLCSLVVLFAGLRLTVAGGHAQALGDLATRETPAATPTHISPPVVAPTSLPTERTVTAPRGQPPGLIAAAPRPVDSDAGRPVTLAFRATNVGGSRLDARTAIAAPEGWQVLSVPSGLVIGPHQSATLLVTVVPPQGAPAGGYGVEFTVTAVDGSVPIAVTATIHIAERHGPALTWEPPPPPIVVAGDTAELDLASAILTGVANVQKPVLPPSAPAATILTRSARAVGTTLPPAPSTAAVANAAASSAPAASSLAGWTTFQIKKTQTELDETLRLADLTQVTARTGAADVRLPPQRDAMRMSTGLGYLQGTDWGGDLSGSGKINGMQTDVNAFITAGAMGFQPRSARISIFAPDGKWRAEGGDMYSDLRGLARGARLSWNHGQRWTPSVGVYVRRAGVSNGSPVVAYRDRLQLLPRVRVGGELTTDGAGFLQVQYTQPKIDVTGFYRYLPGASGGRDQGVSGGFNVWRGVALSGAIRVSDAVNDSRQWQLASLRLPLARQASVTIERSWWSGSANDGSINAVTVQLPLGPLRVSQRLQWGRTDYLQRAVPFGFGQRQMQSTASYRPGPWANVNYQQSTQWFDDGRMQQWDEVASIVQLGRRTSAQLVTAFPDLFDSRRFRALVTQQLSPTLALEVQYGRLSAFQKTVASRGEQSRFMVTIRKSWQMESPSRGGDVRGRAIDQAGYPVSGALVRLGPYSTITDEAGAYAFTRVPEGQLELAFDKDKLPAAYASDEKPRPLTVTRGSRENIDLQVVPLNAIRGHVYLDRNKNGYFDDDEGIPNAVVAVNESVTATSATGAYAFYNQPPGRYRVRLDVQRLAKGLAPASPAELDVELTADDPLFGVDFTVEPKDKPIIMREIPR